ncbi:MAG TPA: SMC-Scp complex subunit ScpB [Candidatus Salinicoccus stercoripullorum]|uniref:SMC-Scp complex subunit ScpB n=1 Tax=Candidatus Salinicoccus stercoripullorum TaxID=2838756 RepID=A0A9D1TZI1_9STAP|nr:SMC-Scp complex subunit ScpB [Candidatus Salinicoccus stercoripullorum]
MEKIDIMEGLLYIAGDVGLTEEQLIMHVPITKEQLHKEVEAYDRPNLKIKRHGESFFLETTPEMEKYIRRLLDERPASKLSQASLEVLSIVAYNQPVSRSDIEMLRGVASDGPVSTLAGKGLIKKKLLQDERAAHFITTDYFLQIFGLKSLEELPSQKDIMEQEEMDLFFNSIEEDE